MTTKTRLTIRNANKVNTGPDPGLEFALFPCEQADVGIATLPEHWPIAQGDGLEKPTDLKYLQFEVVEYGTLYGGYWCERCIEAIGRQPGNTLLEDIQAGMVKKLTRVVCDFVRTGS